MEITKAEALSIALCMGNALDDGRLCASQIELLIRVGKYAGMLPIAIEALERAHKAEVEYEAAEAAEDEKNEAAYQNAVKVHQELDEFYKGMD